MFLNLALGFTNWLLPLPEGEFTLQISEFKATIPSLHSPFLILTSRMLHREKLKKHSYYISSTTTVHTFDTVNVPSKSKKHYLNHSFRPNPTDFFVNIQCALKHLIDSFKHQSNYMPGSVPSIKLGMKS